MRVRRALWVVPGLNAAVMPAALGVFGTGSAWPDLVVAATMAALALWGAAQVLTLARAEIGSA